MRDSYIRRSLEPVIKRAVSEFPAVILTGPRQSGKTTLLQSLFHNKCGYVSLDAPDVRAAARNDPRGFLAMYPAPVIFDEVQNAPDLLPYIREKIDARRQEKGQYLLTGSQNLLLTEKVSESLAGRAAVLRLLPLTRREISGEPEKPFPWERSPGSPGKQSPGSKNIWEGFIRGNYPELVADPKRDASLWHASYVQTYLERDVRTLRQVGDLTQFQNFLRAIAARSAQLVSLTDLSRDVGVALNTAKSWLSVLEASFQVIVLRPWYANKGKRLVKTPKVYFTDVGTLCYLTGLKDPGHASSGPMGGHIMETAVVSEVYKTLAHRGEEPNLYFWRTSSGTEVDLVLEAGNHLVPVEIKLSATPRAAFGDSIRVFRNEYPGRALPGYVVHPGEIRLPLGPGVSALPLEEL